MSDNLFLRPADLQRLHDALAEGACCSIVGLSNIGKSMLLRTAAEENSPKALNIYVDCNLMPALTDQSFYEVTLRAVLDAVKRLGKKAPVDVVSRLETLSRQVIDSERPIVPALSFNDGLSLVCEQLDRRVALLFDEFDDPFGALDGRVFLNLRALHDKFESLVYVTATGAPLAERRRDAEASEFAELFVGHQLVLGMLDEVTARRAVIGWTKEEEVRLSPQEVEFVVMQAGGHPGLLRSATRQVLRFLSGVPSGSRAQALTMVRDKLESDSVIRNECAKLWSYLSPQEQEVLLNLLGDGAELPHAVTLDDLIAKGVLLPGQRPRVFGELFAAYVHRQRRTRQPARAGVWVDVDAGEAWVDGEHVPSLTDLEYRLLLLLYGRLGKICDKYQIVEAVWGQDYIDEVDDARVEKLISRLRSKVEHDPANPKHLITVRGRGYKLAAV
jgi:Transcriptional regulatory protein, C terminal